MIATMGPTGSTRSTLLVLGLFVLCGALALMTASGEDIWHQITRLTLTQILLLLALSLLNYGARALRWFLYARAIGVPLGLVQTVRHYLGGFALTMTPGRLGELIRVRWIGRETGAGVELTAPLVLVDRAADLAATALLLTASVVLMAGGIAGAVPVAALGLAAAVVATRPRLFRWTVTSLWKMTGRWPRIFARARRASKTLRPFSNPTIAVPALLLGFIGWFAEGYAFYLLLDWMGAPVPLWTCIGIFVFAMMTGGATGLPGGIGGAEAAMLALLALQGVPLEVALPATAIIRITTLWFAVGLGFSTFPWAEAASKRGAYALERR
ncbi:MAG: lysylphosphatidylglycerol synthase transmembrane domain-containing protein [Pseudomonadota bacterium]